MGKQFILMFLFINQMGITIIHHLPDEPKTF